MSYILKPQKYNIKTIQELGLTDADFTDAIATDTVPNIRTIASQNIQKITDKMLLPQFYDRELKTEVLKAEFPKLYNSLMFCFIPTLGTTATPTLTIKQGTKNTKVFEVALFTNNGNKYNKIYNDFLFYNSATAPYLEKPEMFQGNIDWRSLWTATQDAEATTKTFAEICGEMNVMAKEFGRGITFRQICTSGTNPNMFRAIREHLGSTSGGFRMLFNKYDTTDTSAPMYIEIWDTGNNYYRLASNTVAGVYQLFDIKGTTTQAVKQYDYSITAGNWSNNSSIILGQTTAGTSGIVAPGVLNATNRGLDFVGTTTLESGGTFSATANPTTLGLFKTNNTQHRNIGITVRLNVSTGSKQEFSIILEKYNGTSWENVEVSRGARSDDGIVESKSIFTTFSTGATDQFNTNSFRIRLQNNSGGNLALPNHTAKIIFFGIK
jgi:hypothetical protein